MPGGTKRCICYCREQSTDPKLPEAAMDEGGGGFPEGSSTTPGLCRRPPVTHGCSLGLSAGTVYGKPFPAGLGSEARSSYCW